MLMAQETASPGFNDFPLPKTLSLCGEPLPLENRRVWEMLDREFSLSVLNRTQVFLWLKRSGRYFPYIEKKLAEAGMPKDLKYLAVAESSLLTGIRSRKGALGLWQFIARTARLNGLRKDHKMDERLDFERSTEAALKYLQTLKGMFDTWTLALAAYNSGEDRLNKEIKEQKVKDYYRLNLPRETERFIFRIAAIKIIMEDPERYGYRLAPQSIYRPIKYDTVPVKITIPRHITDAAKALGTDFKVLKELNPHILGYYLPTGRYMIKVPYGLASEEIKDVTSKEKSEGQVFYTAKKEGNRVIFTDNVKPKESKNISNIPQEKDKPVSKLVMVNEAEGYSVSPAEAKPSSVRLEEEKIKLLVESWRRAWESKRLDDYIGHYHLDFEKGDKDLTAWKRYKKKLNNRYRNILVIISDLKVNVEDRKAWAYFTQQYRSDSFLNHGYKLIEFQREGQSWKIYRERSFNKKLDILLSYSELLNR
jgi:hypothetical protein